VTDGGASRAEKPTRGRLKPMGTVVILKGRLADPRHVELDEPVTNMTGLASRGHPATRTEHAR
jgi:hypothetical protein